MEATDGTDNIGKCGDQPDSTWPMGYAEDYAGYGEYVMYGYAGDYYPIFYASLSGTNLSYYVNFYNDGYYYRYYYTWSGNVTLGY